jgi:hypothetical protein
MEPHYPCVERIGVGTGVTMTAREIVQICATDFATALYVGVDGTRYLVATGNLCADCTTPIIVFDEWEGEMGSMLGYHDVGCVGAQSGSGTTITASDQNRVAEIRRKYLDTTFEVWSALA